MIEEYEDGRDYLDTLKNRRYHSNEKVLLWEILWKTYLDLNIVTYHAKCLMFLDSQHFNRICELLEVNPVLVRNALMNARPPKATRPRWCMWATQANHLQPYL